MSAQRKRQCKAEILFGHLRCYKWCTAGLDAWTNAVSTTGRKSFKCLLRQYSEDVIGILSGTSGAFL